MIVQQRAAHECRPRVVDDAPLSHSRRLGPARIARALLRRAGRGWRVAALVARHGFPGTLLHYWVTPGDDMLLTAVLHELRSRGRRGLWVLTQNPSLFAGNPDVDAVITSAPWLPELARSIGWNAAQPSYNAYDAAEDRDVVDPRRHIITSMCHSLGLDGTIRLRPYLHLTAEERGRGRIAPKQIAVQSSGTAANTPMITKQWYVERFAAVVAALRDRYTIVQLGSAADPLLDGVTDLRGKTNFRESAAVLSQSLTFVGTVGFLMHLARAVDSRSVIVYGGREGPWQSGYTCNENLFTPIACAPCWLRNKCPYDRECMKRVLPQDVVAAVETQVERFGTPLAVDQDVLPLSAPMPAT